VRPATIARAALLALGSLVVASIMSLQGTASADPLEVYADGFGSGGFSGNDGTHDWLGSWSEIGESNGPGSGSVAVKSSGWCPSGQCLHLGGSATGGEGASRATDLEGALTATLEFDYKIQTQNGAAGHIEVAVFGADGWSTLATYGLQSGSSPGSNPIPVSIGITAHASAATSIRFLLVGDEPGTTRSTFFVDDVTITATFDDPAPSTTTSTTTTTTRPSPPTSGGPPSSTTTTTTQPATTTTTTRPAATTTTTTTPPATTTTTTSASTTTTTAPDGAAQPPATTTTVAPRDPRSVVVVAPERDDDGTGGASDSGDGGGGDAAVRGITPEPVTNLATGFLSAAETVRDTAVSAVMLSLVVAWLGLRAIDEGEKRRDRRDAPRPLRPTRERRDPI